MEKTLGVILLALLFGHLYSADPDLQFSVHQANIDSAEVVGSVDQYGLLRIALSLKNNGDSLVRVRSLYQPRPAGTAAGLRIYTKSSKTGTLREIQIGREVMLFHDKILSIRKGGAHNAVLLIAYDWLSHQVIFDEIGKATLVFDYTDATHKIHTQQNCHGKPWRLPAEVSRRHSSLGRKQKV
ncbi:hypothetical protein BVX99_01450 [bacterium F16]|nr:hypothetical protein BVX99_01450 [bacterium F16]